METLAANPDWVRTARKYYTGPESRQPRTDTWLGRCAKSLGVIDQLVLPTLDHQVRILVVGLGFGGTPIPSTWTPYLIAAHLENKDIDYQMTLVDIDPNITSAMQKRQELFFNVPRDGYIDGGTVVRDQYLLDTRQEGMLVPQEAWPDPKQMEYSKGIISARVPLTFYDKLATGDVNLITGDIAVVDLGVPQAFDFIDCSSVLCYLQHWGQQLAIANMAGSVRSGGYITVTDDWGTVLKVNSGWLDERYLDDLGLMIADEIKTSPRYYHEDEDPITRIAEVILKKL